MMATMRLLICILILLMTGCSTTHPPISLSQGLLEADSWKSVLKDHTRRKDLYRLTDHVLDARAVLVTPKLRAALVENKNKFGAQAVQKVLQKLLSMDLKDQLKEASLTEQTNHISESPVTVLFAAYVADSQYEVFNATYSPWDIRLQRGNIWVHPDKIEDVRQSPALRSMFPFIDRFDKVYLMQFPSADYRTNTPFIQSSEDTPLEFRFRSAIADVELNWLLID